MTAPFSTERLNLRIQDIAILCVVFPIGIRINEKHQVTAVGKRIRIDLRNAGGQLEREQVLTAFKRFTLDFLQAFRKNDMVQILTTGEGLRRDRPDPAAENSRIQHRTGTECMGAKRLKGFRKFHALQ